MNTTAPNILSILFSSFWVLVYIIIFLVSIGLVISFVSRRIRAKREKLDQFKLTFLHIKLPQQNEIEIKAAEQFFASIAGLKKSWWKSLWSGQYRISFEIISKSDGIGFYVVVPDEIAVTVEKQINGAYPEAEIDIINPREVWDRGSFTSVAELKLSGVSYYPIKVYEDLQSDSMSSITSSMSKLGEDDVIAIQYIVQPASGNWRKQGRNFVSRVKAKASDPEKKVNIDTDFLEGVEEKISKPGFNLSIRIVCISKDKQVANTHIANVAAAFDQFNDVKYNSFKRNRTRSASLIHNFVYRKIKVFELYIPVFEISLLRNKPVLNTAEMATIFHFPNKDVQTPNIIWLTARKASAPSEIPDSGLFVGINEFRGGTRRIHMMEKDRTRHFYIIGQTGTGKSEFMKSMAVQDIQNGEGIAFIDPHGSDIDDLLEKVPRERINDVILFDASDSGRPLGLNILESETEEQKHMNVNSFIALLYKLYDPNKTGIMGPVLERAIRNVMLTAMVDPESTMIDVLRLLIDQDYVNKFVDKIQDPLVKRYWTDEVAQTSDYHKSERMGYFVSKFDRFVTETTMRRIIGQPRSAFNISKVMAERKILLVDLSKGRIGEENSNFLGLLLVPKILQAALSRASLLGKEEFPNFYLYVDEFQNFATPDFATILSEARKYKLNLTVAHQFISQLTDEIKEAVFGNVGTIACFRVGADDSEYLEDQFEPTFTQSDLINLPIGNCYTRVLVNGQPTPPFSLKVDWDMINATTKDKEVAAAIREHSRMTYGRDANEVEEYINKRAGFAEEKPKSKSSLGDLPF